MGSRLLVKLIAVLVALVGLAFLADHCTKDGADKGQVFLEEHFAPTAPPHPPAGSILRAEIDSDRPKVSTSVVLLRLQFDTGELCSDAELRVYDLTSGQLVRAAKSAADGTVDITDMPEGRFYAVANTVTLSDSVRKSGAQVVDIAPNKPSEQVVVLTPGAKLAGLVMAASGGVEGELMRLASSIGVRTMTIGADGLFEFSPLIDGELRLLVGPKSRTIHRSRLTIGVGQAQFVVLNLALGGIRVLVETGLEGGSTSGPVQVAVRPVPFLLDAITTYHEVAIGRPETLFHIRPGKYLVSLEHESFGAESDWVSKFGPAFRLVEVGEEIVDVQMMLDSPSHVSVAAVNSLTGSPVSAVLTYCLPGIGVVQGTRRRLPLKPGLRTEISLPTGELTLFAISPQLGWGSVTLNLAPGEHLEVDIPIGRSGPSLSIVVEGDGAETIKEIRLFDDQGSLAWYWRLMVVEITIDSPRDGSIVPVAIEPFGVTRGEGYFQIRLASVPVGQYSVQCTGPDGLSASGSATVTSDTTLKATIEL